MLILVTSTIPAETIPVIVATDSAILWIYTGQDRRWTIASITGPVGVATTPTAIAIAVTGAHQSVCLMAGKIVALAVLSIKLLFLDRPPEARARSANALTTIVAHFRGRVITWSTIVYGV